MMRLKQLVLLILMILPFQVMAQDFKPLEKYIQTKSHIKEGGVDVFNYRGQDYLIAVSTVQVVTSKGTKTETQCRTVGSTKAKRDMLSFVNGSTISSYTELVFSENVQEGPEGHKVEASQNYTEVIKESVVGTINQITPLCGWYSEDGSVYYYATMKQIQ